MKSTIFTACLIMAGVFVLVHPIFSTPFIIAAYLLAGKGRMDLDSNTSIILGIIGVFVLLFIFAASRQLMK